MSFNGDCEAAFKLYERLLGAKAEFVITWGASPLADDVPREWHAKLLFARLRARNMTLLGGDIPPSGYRRPSGFTLCLSAEDVLTSLGRKLHGRFAGDRRAIRAQSVGWALRRLGEFVG